MLTSTLTFKLSKKTPLFLLSIVSSITSYHPLKQVTQLGNSQKQSHPVKKNYGLLALLLLLGISIPTGLKAQEDFNADYNGKTIYYHITSATAPYTVAVTYQGTNSQTSIKYSGTLTIPATVDYNGNTYTVTSIGNSAFNATYGLTSISLPATISSIDNYATMWTFDLASIEVDPANPYFSSENGVLFNKDKTTLIRCPRGKTGSYTIPSGVTTIAPEAFKYCWSLTAIIIPNSVTTIGSYALNGLDALNSITIPASVTSIEDQCLYYCRNLNNITVDENNPNYTSENGILFNKDKTELINYPAAKSGAYSIPTTVTNIKSYAFYGCVNLTTISIPNTITTIKNSTFSFCTGLNTVIIPNSVTKIESDAFGSCTNLSSVIIPNSVISIEGSPFNSCNSLTVVEIPASVQNISNATFLSCIKLTAINVDASNSHYSSEEGVLFNKDKSTLVEFPAGKAGNYIFPTTVNSISSSSFYNCNKLTSITCKNTTPPVAKSSNDFYGVPASIPVYVPGSSINAYKAAYSWSQFTNYIALASPSGISTQNTTAITTTTATCNGTVLDLGVPTAEYGICYNTTGSPTVSDQKIASSNRDGGGIFSANLSSLVLGTTYYARAYATNPDNTIYGNEISFTTTLKNPQTITFNPIPNKKVGDADFNLAATASSGLAVTYTSSNPAVATVTPSGTVSIVGAGSTTITASQVGDATYDAAPAVARSLTVGQLPTISYIGGTNTYKVNTSIMPWNPTISGSLAPTIVSTLAGSSSGYTDGVGTAAQFNTIEGITIDSQGNIYAADANNYLIRKISPTGTVTTLAGSGESSYMDGTSTQAKFVYPVGMAVDASNNVYVADYLNHRIRKITTAGVVTTLAGNGSSGYVDGVGSTAQFNNPNGLAVDAVGNVYVSDRGNNCIRKITPAGLVSTLAGDGISGYTDGAANAARFALPEGVAVDANSNIYVSDRNNHCVRKIDINGIVSTLAGNGSAGYADGIGSQAKFDAPSALTTDANGNIYLSDRINNRIRKITPDGTVSTIAGNGNEGLLNGACASAKFYRPGGIAVDNKGNIFVGDYVNNVIRKISLEYQISPALPAGLLFDTTTGSISGTPTATSPLTTYTITCSNGFGNNSTTIQLAVEKATQNIHFNKLYNKNVGDATFTLAAAASSGLPVSYNSSNTAVATISGNTVSIIGEGTTNITATQTGDASYDTATPVVRSFTVGRRPKISYPAIPALGVNIAITPLTPSNIGGTIPLITEQVSVFAGNGTVGDADGNGSNATFYSPIGLTIDASDNLYVAECASGSIRKITPAGDVSTYVGNGQGTWDGGRSHFWGPYGLTIDSNNQIYIAESNGHKISKVSPLKEVSFIAGDGTMNFADGFGVSAKFNWPEDIAVDENGNCYIADTGNHRIRKITPSNNVTTFVGNGMSPSIDGTFANAQVCPTGITIDYNGDFYITESNKLRKVNSSGNVTTIAGAGGINGTKDGNGLNAKFDGLTHLSMDSYGNIYTTEHSANRICRTTPAGKVSTLFTDSTTNPHLTEAFCLSNTLSEPRGIAIDKQGNIFASNVNKNLIYKIIPVGYAIYPQLPTGLKFNVHTGEISGTPTGTSPTTTYRIIGANYCGNDTTYIQLGINSSSQTVNFGSLSNRTYGDADFTVSATASSGLPVTYTSSNPSVATVTTDGTVHIVAAGTTSITASQAGNGSYLPANASQQLIIDQKLITINSAITRSKVYDTTTSATVSTSIDSGVLTGDVANLVLSAVANYDTKNAGTNKTITTVFTLSGSAKDNYKTPDNIVVTDGEITRRQTFINISGLTFAKNYDGNTNVPSYTVGYTGGVYKVDSLNVNFVCNVHFEDSKAADPKNIIFSYSLTGSEAGNYIEPEQDIYDKGRIEPKQLSTDIPIITLTKYCDGNSSASVVPGTLNDVIPADLGNVTLLATATYDSPAIGTGKTITVKYTLSGSAAANYLAPANYTVSNGEIKATGLTITAPTVVNSKIYNGNNDVNATAGNLLGLNPADQNHVTALATAIYDDKNVGTGKTITVSYTLSGDSAYKYTAPATTILTNGVITQKQLTVSNQSISISKIYDASTTAFINNITSNDIEAIDAGKVTITGNAQYDNANVGAGKTININYSLNGPEAGNYLAPSVFTTTGAITAKALTINSPTVVNRKTYDGLVSASAIPGTLIGVETADNSQIGVTAIATYNNKNAGTSKTITIRYTLTGAAASQYTPPANETVNNGIIDQKQLTTSGLTVTKSKAYDASTTATVNNVAINGIETIDNGNVTVTSTASYDTPAVGTGKTITTTYSLSGAESANYLAPVNDTENDGEITPKQLTISAPTLSTIKVYDATTTATVSAGTLGLVEPTDNSLVTVTATANYDNMDAGTGKTITVQYSLSGSAAANYTAPANYTCTTGEIQRKQLSLNTQNLTATKEYDCTTSATVSSITMNGVESIDLSNVSINGTANYSTPDIDNGKRITVVYSLWGSRAGNYLPPIDFIFNSGVITPKALIVAAPGITTTKVYDATTSCAVTAGALTNVNSPESGLVSVTAVATYNDKNVGTNKDITIKYSLTGSAANKYLAPADEVIHTGSISAKQLSVSSQALTTTKSYDGTTNAQVASVVLNGVETVDNGKVSVTATANYNDANIGTSKTIRVVYTLSGFEAGNYIEPIDYMVNNGVITNMQLTVAVPTVSLTKEYDGTASANVSPGTLAGIDPADLGQVGITAIATYSDKNVGNNKTITVRYTLTGSAAARYIAPADETYSGSITRKQLTASQSLTTTKAYDGTTTAAVSSLVTNGVIASDLSNINTNAVANYNTATAGTGKTITIKYTIGGSESNNYLAPVDFVETNGVITKLSLSVTTPTLTSKVYDGTTNCTVTSGVLSGYLGIDAASLGITATGTYDTKNAGSNKTVMVKYTLTGAAAINYNSPADVLVGTGLIMQKQLTLGTQNLITTKAYDGTTQATISGVTVNGIETIDLGKVNVNAMALYSNPTVGTNKTITVIYSLSNTESWNYIKPTNYIINTGTITQKNLTVSSPAVTTQKTYDGTNVASVSAGTLNGVITADNGQVGITATATYNDKNAGANKTITIKYALSGSAASKYAAPADEIQTNGEILPKQLTLSTQSLTTEKEYDGTTSAQVSGITVNGIETIDAGKVDANGTATYSSPDAGNNKSISISYNLSGTEATNYLAPLNGAVTNGIIRPKQLIASAPAVTSKKVYDGTTLATVTAGQFTNATAAELGNIGIVAVANYNSVDAGTGKIITVNYSLSEALSANYLAPALMTYTVNNAEITAKKLTASVPSVIPDKMYDGTNTVSVTDKGSLVGVITPDLAKVTFTATATYNNEKIGEGKPIVIVYALSGTGAKNYLAPDNFVLTGEIADMVRLKPLGSPTNGCEATQMTLKFKVATGKPTQYKISFDDAALDAGFANTTYSSVALKADSGYITIPLPANAHYGIYKASLQMKNALNAESQGYDFNVNINIPASNIAPVDKFILRLNTKDEQFESYKWYKNGSVVEDATKDFMYDAEGLNGEYYVEVTLKNGSVLTSCTLNESTVIDNFTKANVVIRAFPNPVKANQTTIVKVKGLTAEELKKSAMYVYTPYGALVYSSSTVDYLNNVTLPAIEGVYVGNIITSKGICYIFRIIVVSH